MTESLVVLKVTLNGFTLALLCLASSWCMMQNLHNLHATFRVAVVRVAWARPESTIASDLSTVATTV